MTKLIVCILAFYLIIRFLFTNKDKRKLEDLFQSKERDNVIEGEIIEDENESDKGDKT